MKNPLTPAGIERATFRFVAQHLNHCATDVPSCSLCNKLHTYLYHHTVVLDKYIHSNLFYYKHNGDDEPYDVEDNVIELIYFPNGSYIDCLSLTYATNKSKMLKLQYRYKKYSK